MRTALNVVEYYSSPCSETVIIKEISKIVSLERNIWRINQFSELLQKRHEYTWLLFISKDNCSISEFF